MKGKPVPIGYNQQLLTVAMYPLKKVASRGVTKKVRHRRKKERATT